MLTGNKTLPWKGWVENFEVIVVNVLAFLLVGIIATTLVAVAYLFVTNFAAVLGQLEHIPDIQPAALHAFSGILLVLLGLELLDTVKVYFEKHSLRVEVILLVGLIAMGRQVLEIDLYHIKALTLFGFSSLILVLAISYFLVKRAALASIALRPVGHKDGGNSAHGK